MLHLPNNFTVFIDCSHLLGDSHSWSMVILNGWGFMVILKCWSHWGGSVLGGSCCVLERWSGGGVLSDWLSWAELQELVETIFVETNQVMALG